MNDLLEVIKKRLSEEGMTDVFDTLPDGRQFPECIVLTFGLPTSEIIDYAGTERQSQRITVIVKRLTDPKSQLDATRARDILLHSNLESENGSYDFEGIDADPPRPMTWNESGRYVWAFDSVIKTQRKEF